MKTVEESIATAMDFNENVEIVPFLPYILQDFWELGTPPHIVINLILKHCRNYSTLQVLDLGCGKGAVSVKLAEALKCNCLGIDGIKEFVDVAKEKAKEYGVENLCRFEVGDIREKIEVKGKFDVIILGAIGSVFGNYYETLVILRKYLTPQGFIIINDAYIDDISKFQHPAVLYRREIMKQIKDAGMELTDEDEGESTDYAVEFENLKKRCKELIIKYPEKTTLFENYIQAQADEYDALENEVKGSIMVISKLVSNDETIKSTIIDKEKHALELWNIGNPDGFIELSSDDVIYMDPAVENKIEGKKDLEEYYENIRGKIKIESFNMINPFVQLSSDIAVLTYVYEVKRDGQIFRMHCTEVYKSDVSQEWKIIHTHWSFNCQ